MLACVHASRPQPGPIAHRESLFGTTVMGLSPACVRIHVRVMCGFVCETVVAVTQYDYTLRSERMIEIVARVTSATAALSQRVQCVCRKILIPLHGVLWCSIYDATSARRRRFAVAWTLRDMGHH